jgi:hypothetical protein
MLIRRKKNKQKNSNKRNARRRSRASRPSWPIGQGVQIMLDYSGGSRPFFDDDCPICRELRESGEPVFTVDAFGELTLVESGPDVSRDVS